MTSFFQAFKKHFVVETKIYDCVSIEWSCKAKKGNTIQGRRKLIKNGGGGEGGNPFSRPPRRFFKMPGLQMEVFKMVAILASGVRVLATLD